MHAWRDDRTFSQDMIAEWGAFPRKALTYFGVWAVVSAGADLILWSHGKHFQAADYLLVAGLAVGWASATYYAAMLMVSTPMTWRGAARFWGTTLAIVTPIIVGLAWSLIALKLKAWWIVLPGVIFLFAATTIATFFVGWPVWQATAQRVIGPFEAWRATKGIRWQLFTFSCVTSGLNRALPNTSTAHDVGAAALLAAGSSLVSCVSSVIGLSVAVVAWRWMRKAGLREQGASAG